MNNTSHKLHIKSLHDIATLNYRSNIKETHSRYITPLKHFWIMCLTFIVLLLLTIFLNALYVNHVKNNFTKISTNTSMTNILNRTSNSARKYHIIFYDSECSHCQKVIPPAYLLNKISGYNIQYRNIESLKNAKIEKKTGGIDVPLERNITYKNHHLSSKPGVINVTSHARLEFIISLLVIALLIISYVISYIII